MAWNGKPYLRGCASAFCLCAAPGAFAQSTATETERVEERSNQLEEIVVTAQRRSENLQEVPVTVSSFSAETLANANVNSALDLNKLTPSLMLQANSTVITPFLRGVGSNIATAGNEASVAFYIDDVYYTRVNTALMRLNNVGRTEVLSGPQGTLFGRNSSGGLVHVITRQPDPGSNLRVEGSLGYASFDTIDLTGYVASGLGQQAAIDFAVAYHDQREGWGVNLADGSERYYDKTFAARSKLLVNLTERLSVRLAADYAYTNSQIGMAGSSDYSQGPAGFPDGSGVVPHPGFYNVRVNQEEFTRSYDWGTSLHLEHEFDGFTIRNIAAYRETEQDYLNDLDKTTFDFTNVVLPLLVNQFTNEFQIISAPHSRIRYTAGLYYLHGSQGYDGATVTGDALGGLTQVVYSKLTVDSYSAYAQATVPLTDALDITLGGRYTYDRFEIGGRAYMSATGPTGPSILDLVPQFTATDTFEKFSFKAAIGYKLARDINAYASVSRGFKAATFPTFPPANSPAQPETLTAYEIGLKTELFDRRLRVNTALFYYDLQDPQVNQIVPPGVVVTLNAGAARVKGVEMDAMARIAPGLNLRAAAAYLDAEYTDFPNAPSFLPNPNPPYGNFSPVPVDAKGNPLPYAPEFTLTLGGDYTAQTRSGDLKFAVNYYHNSGFSFNPDNRQRQDAYDLLGAQVSFTLPDDSIRLRLWGENLLNEQYSTVGYQQEGHRGSVRSPAAPRTYGIGIDFKF